MNIIDLIKRFKIYLVNYLWIIFGYALRLLLIIFIISKIADKIGIEDFGWYNLGISFFTILTTIAALGFNSSFIIKHLVGYKDGSDQQKKMLGTFLISRIIASVVILFVLGVWITFSGVDSKYWIVFIATSSILFMSNEVLSSYFQRKLQASIYISVTAVSLFIVAILLVIGLYLDFDVYYFITIYVLERVFIFIGICLAFHKKVFKLNEMQFRVSILKKMLPYSWPLMFGALLTGLYARFDQFLIKYYLSINELGIYGTAVILSQIWLVIPSLIVPVLYPKIVELKKDNEDKKYEKTILLLYGILNYSAIAIILLTIIFGEFIIMQLYGEKYFNSVEVLKILIFSHLILFQSHLTTSMLILEEKEKYLFKIKLVSVISNVIFNTIFLANFGITYAAYSIIISAVLSWFILALFDKTMFYLLRLNLKSFLIPFYIKNIKI
ncbi:Membrane protein involved in the export of O-antigen and teichoic acid [Hyunsoonleella jejuensis]|uniref:Membrane protein involved in the export of O-antigen and teichoic acid n=1 Tax=Hyunsoonleella jejuensis TaxID=419940 RepID=A0A1H9G769_9FLAO|nr:flippase [Hyunsoonleella jejuensis]SEQ45863.1 Membrane protein involved in the export of O-antigen and teichoic acid [Hyunsoonleella jejuensis]